MPDPDPQPPQPRAVSPARWLLLLLPSVPMLLMPSQTETVGGSGPSEAQISRLIQKGLFALVGAAALSFALGLLLEKWRRGSAENGFRAVCFGVAIFFINCLLAFAGCSAFPITIRQ